MDWPRIKHFKRKEFFQQDKLLDNQVIYNLDVARQLLRETIHISPVQGAIARAGGRKTSQHYVGPTFERTTRKSTAIDVFIEGIPFLNFSALLYSRLFSGIGVYLDTHGPDGKPWVMFHLDLRLTSTVANPLVWISINEKRVGSERLERLYKYPQSDEKQWGLLQRPIFYTNKH